MRLLLIEDNQRLADYLATALQNGGFAVDRNGG
jgi:DNA-binding response OmpR family regulator